MPPILPEDSDVPNPDEGLTLDQLLGALRRRLPVVVLSIAIAAGVAYGFSAHEKKKYTATASVVFNVNSPIQQIAGLPSGSTSTSGLIAQQANNLELVRGGDAAAKTAAMVGHGLNGSAVAASLSVKSQSESGVIDISATFTSAYLATRIANTYARQFVVEQQRVQQREYRAALAVVHKQLAALTRQQRVGADGIQLQDRAQTLGILAELNSGNPELGLEASVPSKPSSPNTARNAGLGAFVGLVIGLFAAFIFERRDRHIRQPEEFARIYQSPVLGTIPTSRAIADYAPTRDKGTTLPAKEAEAFNMLRARLRLLNRSRELRTIVMASPMGAEGRSTVARHLAEAAARAGSHVLLLEADFRSPILAKYFHIDPDRGLADALINSTPLSSVVQQLALSSHQALNERQEKTLDVLPAGADLPSNPMEFIESDEMDVVLAQAKGKYDLVVIDTPPLGTWSDGFGVLAKVDGIVLVASPNHTRGDIALQLHQLLVDSDLSVLGIVINRCGDVSSSVEGRTSSTFQSQIAAATDVSPAEHLNAAFTDS